MSITIELSPDTETRLLAQAAAKGLSVEQYLTAWIETNLPTAERLPSPKDSEDWVKQLKAFGNNPALANVPPLSDEAISRESIYGEREDSQL